MTIDKKDLNHLYHLEYRRRKLEDDLKQVELTIKRGHIVLATENRVRDSLTRISTSVDHDIGNAVVKFMKEELGSLERQIIEISYKYQEHQPERRPPS